MQILADEKRAASKAAATKAKRVAKPAAVKEAGQKFYKSMLVDSAYQGELFDDFSAWLTKNEVATK
jgi:hypothetical protein